MVDSGNIWDHDFVDERITVALMCSECGRPLTQVDHGFDYLSLSCVGCNYALFGDKHDLTAGVIMRWLMSSNE